MSEPEQTLSPLAALLARAEQDAALRQRLIDAPQATLEAEGFVLEDDAQAQLRATEISDAELEAVAGGGRLLDRLRRENGGRLVTRESFVEFIGRLCGDY